MYNWEGFGFREEELGLGICTDSIGEDESKGEAIANQNYRREKSRLEKNKKSM